MSRRLAVPASVSCLLFLLLAPTHKAVADTAAAAVTLFAGVASAPGVNDTRWRSEVVLTNPNDAAADVFLEIVPRGESGVVGSLALTLAAGETRRIADPYAALNAPAGAGTLRVTGNVLSWVRTFNQGETGTFGQDVPPAAPGRGFAARTPVFFPINTPADPKTESRSNLLLLNTGGAAASFTITAGGVSKSYDVGAGVFVQISGVGGWLGLPSGPAMLAVTADQPWSGMVSTIDPVLGDPTTVRGLIATARTVTQFSGVASAPGVNGTQWRSEATLYNPRTSPQSVTLELIPRGESSVAARVTLALAPLQLQRLPDVYTALSAVSGAGTLRVTGDVLTWIRTFNQGVGVTFGQDVPEVAPGVAYGPTASVSFPVSTPATIAADFRSNFLVYNHESRTITCTLAAGSVSRTLDVAAGTFLQQNNVGAWLGLPPGVFTVSVTANGRWTGMVATIDPFLGDPTTMIGIRTTGNPLPTAAGTPVGSAVSAAIGPSGGTLASADGRFSLTVPAGALAATTTFSIEPVTNTAWSGIGISYRLGPGGTNFATPATLKFTAANADTEHINAQGLTMGYQDGEGYWHWLSTAVTDPAARTVSAAITKIAAAGTASRAPSPEGTVPAELALLGPKEPPYSLLSGLVLTPTDTGVWPKMSVSFDLRECLPAKLPGDKPQFAEPFLFECETLFNPDTGSQSWAVNGVAGGDATYGTIEADWGRAVFTAPARAPNPRTVTVSVDVDRYGTYQNVTAVSHVTISDFLTGVFHLTRKDKSGFLQVHAEGNADLKTFYADENGVAYSMNGVIAIDETLTFQGYQCYAAENRIKAIPSDANFSIQRKPSLAQHWVMPAVSWNFVCSSIGLTIPVNIQFFLAQPGSCSQAVWLPLADENHPTGSYSDTCNPAWTVDATWDFKNISR